MTYIMWFIHAFHQALGTLTLLPTLVILLLLFCWYGESLWRKLDTTKIFLVWDLVWTVRPFTEGTRYGQFGIVAAASMNLNIKHKASNSPKLCVDAAVTKKVSPMGEIFYFSDPRQQENDWWKLLRSSRLETINWRFLSKLPFKFQKSCNVQCWEDFWSCFSGMFHHLQIVQQAVQRCNV